MKLETIVLNEERGVTLTAILQPVSGETGRIDRPAMVVLPGGGYTTLSEREAEPIALGYAKAGYQTFVLRYTLRQKGAWPLPIDDFDQAMELIKKNAAEWHLDPERIGVVGFSAGGHLAACAATVAKNRPAAAVLVYPAILPDICDACQPGMAYPAEHVTMDTCPCFIAAARDDTMVPVKNSLAFAQALAEAGIAFEQHIYSYGEHGFADTEEYMALAEGSRRLKNWMPDSLTWLEERWGRLTPAGYTEPEFPAITDGNKAPTLSVNCTLAYLAQQGEAAQEALAPVFAMTKQMAGVQAVPEKALFAAMGNTSARLLLGMMGLTGAQIREINEKLGQIENKR